MSAWKGVALTLPGLMLLVVIFNPMARLEKGKEK